MLDVLTQVIPFFVIIGLGWISGVTDLFGEAAGRAITRFVFYVALSALLFRFTAGLDWGSAVDPRFLGAYTAGCLAVYAIASLAGWLRGESLGATAVESQCAVIGNVGFLGVPVLATLFGPEATGPLVQILIVDTVLFAALIVALFSVHRRGRVDRAAIGTVGRALAENPMVLAIFAGLVWSVAGLPVPGPMDRTLEILAAAATPGALFAVGLSLAGRQAERLVVAMWLSAAKLVLHPLAILAAVWIFGVEGAPARMMIACAALPVATNIYILAESYGIAPQRASTAILVSTAASLLTMTVAFTFLLP